MKIELSPIILFAYNRPWHTEQVLKALKQNEFADQSKLIIYVDGPKENASPEQIESIEKVRNLVIKEQWCKTVEIHIADKNIGCRNSIIAGITEVLNSYEAVIVLEDDIVTSPYFLRFMNSCLNYYKKFNSVFSVSAYNLPPNILPIPDDYNYDMYISYRQLNWGWGTWQDRWEQVDWNKKCVPEFLSNEYQVEAFTRGGDDLVSMLNDEYEGRSDAWDIQFTFSHFQKNAVSIVPCISYTNNIGLDDSGTHTLNKKEGRYENNLNLCIKNPIFLDILYEDKRIINLFYNAFCAEKRPVWKKIINRLSRMMGQKNIFNIKKKIYA